MEKIQFDLIHKNCIELGELKVVTRDGNPVRIICWDKKGPCEIVALIDLDGYERICTYHKNGRLIDGEDSPFDLFLIEN